MNHGPQLLTNPVRDRLAGLLFFMHLPAVVFAHISQSIQNSLNLSFSPSDPICTAHICWIWGLILECGHSLGDTLLQNLTLHIPAGSSYQHALPHLDLVYLGLAQALATPSLLCIRLCSCLLRHPPPLAPTVFLPLSYNEPWMEEMV